MNEFVDRCNAALERNRKVTDGNDPEIVNFPYEALAEIVRAGAGAAAAEVLLIVPIRQSIYRPDNYTERIWRQLARRGLSVRKVVVVPHRGVAASVVEQVLAEDSAAGVSTLVVTVSELVSHSFVEATAQYIFDKKLVIREPVGAESASAAQWSASARAEDVGTAIKRWEAAWSLATDRPGAGSLSLEEPLVMSADLVSGVAEVLCTADHVDRGDCSWYHGAWQYMRLFDLVSTPSWHDAFYREALGNVLSQRRDHRVLITGTADYSVMAYVFHAAASVGMDVPVRVVDLCPTPLFACRWYARSVGRTIEVLEADILEASLEQCASLVITDAFLTRFSPVDAARVISRWRELLTDDGFVITTVRVHDTSQRGQSEEDAVRAFTERALLRARRWAPFMKRTPEELVCMASTYARRMKSNVLGTEEEIHKLFSNGGFRIDVFERATVPGELWPSTYVRVLAQVASGGK